MFNKILNNEKALFFIGGVVCGAIGIKFLKSECCRKMCVKGLAQGMRLQKEATEAFQNMKEDAADICHDAKNQCEKVEE